ncbi:RNA polymerase II elongation factor-like protein [Dinothrombium tinctorium]|uniref:RNA polymerase II elongation factor-like protein n=1 Tax=Dinothrombium tinctorium TaxID=1965070 RepID=A0A3S3PII5_9ACAR|nr:RNA polymerase II elongation factor-like protein [Dinothrombium tinctorium]RWS01799.1 RNA polymerase II elongation factor-like protein [Dinothrombium tinctorium]RWS12188.1 RNA polymerase II elongation factor-like protein [Dinothrombium tinctorium]
MSTIKFETSDGHLFEIERETAFVSKFVKDLTKKRSKDNHIFLLKPLNSVIFEKVVEWMRNHQDNTQIEEESDGSEESDEEIGLSELDKYDEEFLDEDLSMLLNLLKAASFLRIKGLFNVCCMKIFTLSKGRSSEEICYVRNAVSMGFIYIKFLINTNG